MALEDEGLTFDASLCDGCALCAAACPEQAIDIGKAAEPLVNPPVGADRAFLACERVAEPSEAGAVSCLHAVALATLAQLHARGVYMLVAAQADCSACARAQGQSLTCRLADLRRLIDDRGLPPMAVRELEISAWREERDDAARMSRRSLFRAALGGGRTQTSNSDGAPTTIASIMTPDALLAASDRATISMFSPTLDPARCNACGVCVEVCGQDVIRLQGRNSDDPHYAVEAMSCNGCHLCVDSCETHAITISAWGAVRPPPIHLVEGRCRSCSNPFLAVREAVNDTDLCRICANTSHHRNLYQVLP